MLCRGFTKKSLGLRFKENHVLMLLFTASVENDLVTDAIKTKMWMD